MAQGSSKGGSVFEKHLRAGIEQRLKKLVKSVQDSLGERSVETVHELRVAARRLRAFALTFSDVLEPKTRSRLDRELKRVAKAVGSLRDLDVLLALVEERTAGTPNELARAALEHLLEVLEDRRARVATVAEKRLREVDVDALSRLVRRAARDVMGRLLPDEAQRAYAKTVLERLILEAAEQEPPRDGVEHPEQLHRLRIDVKEIRYALELFEPVLGAHFAILHERAVALQELLGTHHDLTVLGEIIVERNEELVRRNRPALSAGLQLAATALSAERQAVVESFRTNGFRQEWWGAELTRALEPG